MAELKPVDLYLEGRLGQWVLDQCDPDDIGTVWSVDQGMTGYANNAGFKSEVIQETWPEFVTAKVMLNVHGQRIFPAEVLSRYKHAYNIHPSYLPFGKGQNSAFWVLWNREPAGASLHELDHGIDTGPVIDREQVDYDETTFLGELLEKLDQAQKQIFRRNWQGIRDGNGIASINVVEKGSSYSHKSYVSLVTDLRENWKNLTSEELVRLLRCLHTFPVELESKTILVSARPKS